VVELPLKQANSRKIWGKLGTNTGQQWWYYKLRITTKGKKMKSNRFLIMFVGLLLLPSCGPQQYKETRNGDTVVGVSDQDKEMNAIIAEARSSVGVFLEALADPKIDRSSAQVKYPFPTDPGSTLDVEHMWIADITQEGGRYYGILVNDPFYIQGMKFGDLVQFDITKISDWRYIQEGYIVGGKSIKYFYDQMSEEERREFDQNAGFEFR
jgi:uncharacterized protein YegJ (DUF2314 family)